MSTFDISKFARDKNICIEASAGTGKTYTVQMIVAKLLKDWGNDLSLDNILIVTFTEKAAGELRDRIRSKLRDANLLEQLKLVDNAPIYTIHSFCKHTLDEFSFEAHQSEGLSLIDENEVTGFIEGWIRDELSKDKYFQKYHSLTGGDILSAKTLKDKVKNYYLDSSWNEVPEIAHIENTVSVETADSYLDWPDDELIRLKPAVQKKSYNALELDFLLDMADKLEDSASSGAKAAPHHEIDTFMEHVAQLRNEVEEAENNRHSEEKAKLLALCDKILNDHEDGLVTYISIPSSFPKNVFGTKATQTQLELCQYFKDLFSRIVALEPLKNADGDLKRYLEDTYVPVLYKKWQLFKMANKMQSFDDMIRNVRESVCEENSKLKAALQAKYKYAIIDEFQDTNQKQWDIFRNIFMNVEDHAICVVGDPKQSIYAFQGADVEVYSKAVAEISGGDPDLPFSLSTNYRSTNSMIDFCNTFFSPLDGKDYFGTQGFSFSDSNHPSSTMEKPAPTYNSAPVSPVWIPQKTGIEPISEEEFAQFAVQQIIDCCSRDSSGKTKVQVYKKTGNEVKLSNVSFRDFAVLCKSKAEMKPVKQVFAKSGIPYNHYKENNLFGGKECRDWIALLSAIHAPDFSSYNRKILNECLFSSFFAIPFEELTASRFDEPDNSERIIIMGWKKTAKERKWALLQEQIYGDTGVEARLSRLDKLNSLTKLHQIGDYAVSYLYKNNCSLGELIDHLTLLSKAAVGADEEESNLVEKGTDFDTVKIMTIHASKGLEFPIVIAPAGVKSGLPTSSLENQRLFYVAYTRASSLMMLPWSAASKLGFLNEVFGDSRWNTSDHLRKIDFDPDTFNPDYNKKAVKKILEIDSSSVSDCETEKKTQMDNLSAFAGWVALLDTEKLSYSKLSHGRKNETIESEGDADHQRNRDSEKENDNSEFDRNCKRIACSYNSEKCVAVSRNYPKGSKLGEAVHQTFEEAAFKRIGELSEEDAANDSSLCSLIRKAFKGQHICMDESDSERIIEQTGRIVWNTLNATLPEINGSHETGRQFSLKELEDGAHLAEVEFNMNPDIIQNKDLMRDYFTGFIDLLFVRKTGGRKVYSILDWKTDSLSVELYADENVMKLHTDKAYSIQRVLYSYCLVKWLKQFNPGKDEHWIFDNLFGGIYYAYVRGCAAGTGNGIYAQTWENWTALKTAFDRIVSVKIPQGSN